MFRNLFNPDNALMITMSQITDCIFLSLFWLLGCVPVITVGASTAALYDAVSRGLRQGDKHSWQRFFRSYRQNLKSGMPSSVIFAVLAAVLLRSAIALWNSAAVGSLSWMAFSGIAFVLLIPAGVLYLVFPVLSRFENSTAGLWANTARLGLANLPGLLALSALHTVAGFLCLRWIFPLFFLPALAALLGSLFIEPMLKPYMGEEA